MEKHFMIDIEATGIDPKKEELLQIGIVRVVFYAGQWVPEAEFQTLVHTDRQPESEFAKVHLADLMTRCRAMPIVEAQHTRAQVLDFFRRCGATGVTDTYMMGWNAASFDLPFLVAKEVLVPSSYETVDGVDRQVGDFHYRVYEMGGAIAYAQNIHNRGGGEPAYGRDWVMTRAKELATGYGKHVITKEHDALWDCYDQINLLNGLIALGRVR